MVIQGNDIRPILEAYFLYSLSRFFFSLIAVILAYQCTVPLHRLFDSHGHTMSLLLAQPRAQRKAQLAQFCGETTTACQDCSSYDLPFLGFYLYRPQPRVNNLLFLFPQMKWRLYATPALCRQCPP